MIDLAAITQAHYAQLATAAAGAAVRAAVAGIVTADTLDKPLPGEHFLAFRERAVSGQSYDMRAVVSEWWVYDVRDHGTTRINATIQLIEMAYPKACIAFCHTEVTQIGALVIDTALNRSARFIQLTSHTRG